MQKIQDTIYNNRLAFGVFIDLQKAFDTVNHKILLEKLAHYGISGKSNIWFESYLTNRKQYVSINGADSSTTTTLHGVPQESVLGPLLFLIYINDLHKCIHNSSTFHFADDTNLLYIPEKKTRNRNIIRKLNNDLKSLHNWLLSNKISLNSTKTELIVFRKKTVDLPDVKIVLNGVKLIPKSTTNYLGLIMDEHLTFKEHILFLNAKLNRANNLLALSRHYLPQNLMRQLYYAQFNSHLAYGCQIWGQQNITKTITLQKKAVRLLTFSQKNSPSSPLFKQTSIVKLKDQITINNMLFVHSTLRNDSPSYFKDFFELYMPNHSFNTRNNVNSSYSIPPGSVSLSNLNKETLKFTCAKNWNENIKKIPNLPENTLDLLTFSKIKIKKQLQEMIFMGY